MQLEEQVAKLAYQFAELIDDKEIDKKWYDLLNRERWFNFAEVAIPIIQKAERERLADITSGYLELELSGWAHLILTNIIEALKGEADGTG